MENLHLDVEYLCKSTLAERRRFGKLLLLVRAALYDIYLIDYRNLKEGSEIAAIEAVFNKRRDS